MFSGFSSLFGRNYVIAHLLPSAIGVTAAHMMVWGLSGVPQEILEGDTDDLAGLAVLVGACIWIASVVFMALNRSIYRFFEGYGLFNPLVLGLPFEQLRYIAAVRENDALHAEPESSPRDLTRSELLVKTEFPDSPSWVLPTKFGNLIRAAESYPRVVYGLESIWAWPRMLSVVEDGWKGELENARAPVDLWCNLSVLFLVLPLAEAAISVMRGAFDMSSAAVLVGLLVLSRLAYLGACATVGGWTHLVRSTFDLHRARLAEALGYDLPRTAADERALWGGLNQVFGYADRAAITDLERFRRVERAGKVGGQERRK